LAELTVLELGADDEELDIVKIEFGSSCPHVLEGIGPQPHVFARRSVKLEPPGRDFAADYRCSD
jgi:hypothetical protein